MRQSKSKKPPKEDGISMNTVDERRSAAWALTQIQKKNKDKEFVRVKIFNGYRFIEKSKYERQTRKANNQQNT